MCKFSLSQLYVILSTSAAPIITASHPHIVLLKSSSFISEETDSSIQSHRAKASSLNNKSTTIRPRAKLHIVSKNQNNLLIVPVENNKRMTANANQRRTYKDVLMRTSEKYRMKEGKKIRRNE